MSQQLHVVYGVPQIHSSYCEIADSIHHLQEAGCVIHEVFKTVRIFMSIHRICRFPCDAHDILVQCNHQMGCFG